jgi:hypothetical protein
MEEYGLAGNNFLRQMAIAHKMLQLRYYGRSRRIQGVGEGFTHKIILLKNIDCILQITV